MIYFPILEPDENEEYTPDYPGLESPFMKGYVESRTLGYRKAVWKVQYSLLDTFGNAVRIRTWVASTQYAVGDYIRSGSYVYMCVVSGESGSGSAPTWNATPELTQTDNEITWVCYKDNQIQALLDFVENRKGKVEPFFVYVPLTSEWMLSKFGPDPVKFTPVKSGLYKVVKADVTFEEF